MARAKKLLHFSFFLFPFRTLTPETVQNRWTYIYYYKTLSIESIPFTSHQVRSVFFLSFICIDMSSLIPVNKQEEVDDVCDDKALSNVDNVSPLTTPRAETRRSNRKKTERRYLLNETLVESGKVIQTKIDEMCGMDQPGRNFIRDDDEISRNKEECMGTNIFQQYLKRAGWIYAKSDRELVSTYVFLQKGTSAKTTIEGVSKFYSYEAIWRK